MKREQQANSDGDVLANVGESLREWSPSRDEERGALERVWTGLRWKANQVPAEVVRSVELGPRPAPHFSTRPWALAVAAALVIAAIGGALGGNMVWPRGVRVYAAGADGLEVTLADDSRVEMRAHSEMIVGRASDGIQIDLKDGDIIVSAAEQRDRPLYVRTKDMTVGVDGTVLLMNAGRDGSRVAVIAGEVRVREGSVETRLRAGEEVATSPTIARRPLTEAILWSRNADAHLAILESFRRGIAQTAGPLSPVGPPAERQRGAGAASPAAVEFEEASIRECDPDNLPAVPAGARG